MSELKGTVATKGAVNGKIATVYGKDGDSAYEVAVANGFEGTEEEWLESLKIMPDVDQTYNSASDNPQSGIAISEAFAMAAINGTASGTEVCITDVSPLEHNISVKVDDAEATVIRNGKNLFDQSKYVTGLNNSEDQKYELKDSEGNTYFSIEYLPNEDCLCFWGELNSKHNAQAKITPNIVGEEGAYYLPSVEYVGGFIDYYGIESKKYSNFQLICAGSIWLEVPRMKNNTVVVPESKDIKPLPQKYITQAGFYITSGIRFDNFKIRIQLEKIEDEKGKRTDYERFVERTEHTPNADGTLIVPSAYPTTILTTDTEGVTIEAEYNVDTKAYIDNKFAELQALVLEG
jgi:hypothetical protein